MDKTYKRHSFTKLWIATAMFIFCCFATSAFAQEAVDADTFMTTTETITEVKTTPEIAETATASAETTPDTIGELALGLNTVWMLLAAMLVFFMQPGFAMVYGMAGQMVTPTHLCILVTVEYFKCRLWKTIGKCGVLSLLMVLIFSAWTYWRYYL